MRRRATTVLVALTGALAFAGVAHAWQAPVDTPLVDNWRPPANQYAAGNRGVDFAPASGTSVKSAGSGSVTFAGQVGGTLYVVVTHDGGIRTTYGNLSEVKVTVGQKLNGGDVLGTAGPHLHFGVRIDGNYVDPNTLFGRARLVPMDG